jgi:hypothetical protein
MFAIYFVSQVEKPKMTVEYLAPERGEVGR